MLLGIFDSINTETKQVSHTGDAKSCVEQMQPQKRAARRKVTLQAAPAGSAEASRERPSDVVYRHVAVGSTQQQLFGGGDLTMLIVVQRESSRQC